MKPEHIIKLAIVGGITIDVSLVIILSFLTGLLEMTLKIIASLAFVILLGRGIAWFVCLGIDK